MSLLLFYGSSSAITDAGTATVALSPSAPDEHLCPVGYGDHITYGTHLLYVGCEAEAAPVIDAGTATIVLSPSGAELVFSSDAGSSTVVITGSGARERRTSIDPLLVGVACWGIPARQS